MSIVTPNSKGLRIAKMTTNPVKVMTQTEPAFFCKLLLNGASYDAKVRCIQILWAGAR